MKYNKYTIKQRTIARNHRKKGLSLAEISSMTRIPRGTIGNWVRDIELNNEQVERLIDKQRAQNENIKNVSLENHIRRLRKHKKWYEEGKRTILSSDVGIMGIIAYACEGTHSIKSTDVVITNTEPGIINLFLDMIEMTFGISRNEFRCRVHIHNYHNEKKIILYWSKMLGIKNIKTYINKKQQGGKRKIWNSSKRKGGYMGCAHVIVSNMEVRCKLEGLIDKYTRREYSIGVGKV